MAKDQSVIEDNDLDVKCGYGKCKPSFLQRLNNPRFMLFTLCFVAISQGFVVNGVFNVNVTSLERRFHLRSTELGLIAAAYDLSAALFGIFISYYGSCRYKSRWLTLATLAMALASLLMALPHFTTGLYEWGEARIKTCNYNETAESPAPESCENSQLRSNLWYFAIGMVLYGVGGGVMYTVGTGYIDDSVTALYSPVYMGLFFGCAALGPGIGYLVGGALLNLYVDFDKVSRESVALTAIDPRYVGAWWVGHLISIGLFVLVAVPFSCFGAEMPNADDVRKNRVSQQHKGTTADGVCLKPERPPLKSLPKVILALLKNPPFLFTTLAGTCDFFLGNGFAPFTAKFIQNHFHVSSSQAALYSGAVITVAFLGGISCGGFVCRCFKLKVKGMLRFCVGASFLALLFTPLFWTSCQGSDLAGLNSAYLERDVTPSLTDTCNSNCGCTLEFYEPVCSNGTQYFSPCHAGCYDIADNKKSFSNCKCAPVLSNQSISTVMAGSCTTTCSQLYIILPLLFCFVFATLAADVPAEQAVLRSIDQNHRVISLGLNRFAIRILGSVVGPIVFGAVTDSACTIWQTECGKETSCWVYDGLSVRRSYFILFIVMKCFATLFYFLAYYLYQPPNSVSSKSNVDSYDKSSPTFTNVAFSGDRL